MFILFLITIFVVVPLVLLNVAVSLTEHGQEFAAKWLPLFAVILSFACWLSFPLLYSFAQENSNAHAEVDSEGGTFVWAIIGGLFSFGFLIGNLFAMCCGIAGMVYAHLQKMRFNFVTWAGVLLPLVSDLLHIAVDYVILA
jgi:hypothetical protein